MARRRLMTILATTTVAAGMSVAPASAQSLGDLTSTVEDTVEDVTGVVEDTTEPVTSTVDQAADSLTATTDEEPSTLDTEDLPLPEDPPLDVDLEVDVAPEDEDGSPQLEIDGGVTVADEEIDVGSLTDPIEAVVDPDDPDPTPPRGPSDSDGPADPGDQTGTSSNSIDHRAGSRPGGVLEGGAVTAAGTAPRAVGDSRPGTSPSGSAMGESFAAFVAGNRGSDWSRSGTDNTAPSASEAPPPRVAGPRGEPLEAEPGPGSDESTTSVASGEMVDPREGLLKALAALMVLGTAVVVSRRTLGRA